MNVTVRESTISDCYALAPKLRERDAAEAVAMGYDVRGGIRKSFKNGILRKTYLVDGEIAAMSGLCGGLLSDIGYPYLMTTPAVEKVPVTFVKLARAAVDEMLQYRIRLEGYVPASYHAAIRLLQVLRFDLSAPAPFGPHGELFHTFSLIRGD